MRNQFFLLFNKNFPPFFFFLQMIGYESSVVDYQFSGSLHLFLIIFNACCSSLFRKFLTFNHFNTLFKLCYPLTIDTYLLGIYIFMENFIPIMVSRLSLIVSHTFPLFAALLLLFSSILYERGESVLRYCGN